MQSPYLGSTHLAREPSLVRSSSFSSFEIHIPRSESPPRISLNSPRRNPAVPYVFPASSNSKVFVTHLWVTVNYWLFGGKFGARRCIIIVIGLLILVGVAGSLAYPHSFPSTDETFDPSESLAWPKPTSGPISSDPEDLFLNLEGSFSAEADGDTIHDELGSEWDLHRRYGIVIDAGSSGSRVLVYSWVDPILMKNVGMKGVIQIEKGTKGDGEWMSSIEPGISSLETDPSIEMVTEYLHPLLKFSASIVPKAKLSSTPIYLFATAGMRLVHKDARESILQNACKAAMRAGFSVLRGCESHFRVISGKTEGIFGWLTVNYLKGGFSGPVSSTFGFLDMGGASTQIAFEPDAQQKEKHSGDLTSVRLRTLQGENLQYNVFSTTFLGFGVNEARKTYLNNLSDLRNGNKSPSQQLPLTTKIPRQEAFLPMTSPTIPARSVLAVPTPYHSSGKSGAKEFPASIADPCLPSGLLIDNVMEDSHNASHILGTGSLDECVALQAPLLNKTRACDLDPCFFNGVHGPVAKFSEGKPFLAASEYFYTPHSIYDLPDGPLSPVDFRNAASKYCSTPWPHLLQDFESKKWSNVDIKRVQMQCFKSAWLLTVLHEGLGAPKTVTTIEPVNEINGFSVSWTLGAMIIHVSGTIHPSSSPSEFSPIEGSPIAGDGGFSIRHPRLFISAKTFWAAFGIIFAVAILLLLGFAAGSVWIKWKTRRRRGSKPLIWSAVSSRGSGTEPDEEMADFEVLLSPRVNHKTSSAKSPLAINIKLNDLESGSTLLPRVSSSRSLATLNQQNS